MERYGSRITVNGTTQFKAQVIRAAVDSQLPITFADPALESRRLALLKKENTHERPDRTGCYPCSWPRNSPSQLVIWLGSLRGSSRPAGPCSGG